MQCPKCKKEIEDNSLKCTYCGTKVASKCKDCGTINLITAKECTGCHKILIKYCSACGAANLPEARVCRKCGLKFAVTKHTPRPEYDANRISQQKIKIKIIDAIKNIDKNIITISSESGIGKSLILKNVVNELNLPNIIWMQGSCTHITQLSPFGYFQDLLLNFFNINNFCLNTLQLKRNSINFFKQDFPTLTNDEIIDLLNLLYPEKLDNYENIYNNKINMFAIIKKVIMTILSKMKIIFIIDKFELIDGMSFDFLKELLSDDYILQRVKFIILTNKIKPGLGLISSQNLTENNYEDMIIAPFTKNQTDILINQYPNIKNNENLSNKIYKISSGNPAIIEQMLNLFSEAQTLHIKQITYSNIEEILSSRLNILKKENITAYRILIALNVLGNKFYPAMLENFDNDNLTEFTNNLNFLIKKAFITQNSNLVYEFKSYIVWETINEIIKNDNMYIEILNELNEQISIYKHSSIAILGYIAQKLNNTEESVNYWTILMKQASFIGDIGLYIISQKQTLKLIEDKHSNFYLKVKKNIYTRVGKILEPIDYKLSFEYLQKAIMMLNDNEECEYIELLGYLASTSMQIGNYSGVLECVNYLLNKLPDTMDFEKTLIKVRQVRPLLRLGNYGQVINLVETEILPSLEKYINKNKFTNNYTQNTLYHTWLNVYLDYAESLTYQGDNRSFEAIKTIFNTLEKNKIVESSYNCRTYLALALANTIKGDIITSNKILEDILKEYTLDNMDTFIISRWNFIDIINKFITKDYNSLYTDLFNVVAYANNVNDNFSKNILKTLLAKMLKDKNENKKALEILEEQVSYFAKEKIATGVLLSWYLIAKTRLITNGTQFALDVTTKALDIAEGPSINNYFFIALYNKLIGEIYMAKQDFDSAKIYIEKAISISKQFDIELILINSYILYAKYYQELALPKTTLRVQYIKQALKMFQLAQNVDIATEHKYIQKHIKEELSVLTSFCKLNGILLKKPTK